MPDPILFLFLWNKNAQFSSRTFLYFHLMSRNQFISPAPQWGREALTLHFHSQGCGMSTSLSGPLGSQAGLTENSGILPFSLLGIKQDTGKCPLQLLPNSAREVLIPRTTASFTILSRSPQRKTSRKWARWAVHNIKYRYDIRIYSHYTRRQAECCHFLVFKCLTLQFQLDS